MLEDVTLLIKTFERQEALERLLDSIARMDLGCPVIIADDSKSPYKEAIERKYGSLVTEYVTLPYNVGLSRGRNEMLSRVKTKYFVLNDDDFVYDERANLSWMRKQLESTDLELLGGVVYEPNRPGPISFRLSSPRASLQGLYRRLRTLYERQVQDKQEVTTRFYGSIDVTDRTVSLNSLSYTPPVTQCDYTLNFFMADTEAVCSKVEGWDERLKVCEHWEFFYRAKLGGLQVGATEEAGVGHRPNRDGAYGEHRLSREAHYRRLGLERHGLSTLKLQEFTALDLEAQNDIVAEGEKERAEQLRSSASAPS